MSGGGGGGGGGGEGDISDATWQPSRLNTKSSGSQRRLYTGSYTCAPKQRAARSLPVQRGIPNRQHAHRFADQPHLLTKAVLCPTDHRYVPHFLPLGLGTLRYTASNGRRQPCTKCRLLLTGNGNFSCFHWRRLHAVFTAAAAYAALINCHGYRQRRKIDASLDTNMWTFLTSRGTNTRWYPSGFGYYPCVRVTDTDCTNRLLSLNSPAYI